MIDTKTAIRQIMTSPVISVQPDANMEEIKEIFETQGIHHIPVILDKKVVGIVSKGDYFRLQHHLTFFNTKTSTHFNQDLMRSMLVEEIMTKQVATLHQNDSLAIAAAIFRPNLFHAIPILDDERCLVGILTTYDLIQHAYQAPKEQSFAF